MISIRCAAIIRGRQIKTDKRGAIPNHLAPILDRLNINSTGWMKLVTEFDQLFTNVVGNAAALFERAAKSDRRWYRGQVTCHEAFG